MTRKPQAQSSERDPHSPSASNSLCDSSSENTTMLDATASSLYMSIIRRRSRHLIFKVPAGLCVVVSRTFRESFQESRTVPKRMLPRTFQTCGATAVARGFTRVLARHGSFPEAVFMGLSTKMGVGVRRCFNINSNLTTRYMCVNAQACACPRGRRTIGSTNGYISRTWNQPRVLCTESELGGKWTTILVRGTNPACFGRKVSWMGNRWTTILVHGITSSAGCVPTENGRQLEALCRRRRQEEDGDLCNKTHTKKTKKKQKTLATERICRQRQRYKTCTQSCQGAKKKELPGP